MKEEPLVSVIIPTYKRPDMLGRAIDSVLNQTYDNIEIVVVDDNDEDSEYRKETEEFMEIYITNSKIKYIKHKKNKGGSAARNTGIKTSRGKYVAFLDDDDEFFSKKIEKQVKKLTKLNDSWGGVYCSYLITYPNGGKEDIIRVKEGNLQKKLLLGEHSFGGTSSFIFRRKVMIDLGMFDEEFERHQDWELLIRFFRNYKMGVVSDILLKKHHHYSKINPNKIYTIKEKYLTTFKNDIHKFDKTSIKKIYQMHWSQVSFAYLEDNQIKKSYKYYKKSLSFGNNLFIIIKYSLIVFIKLLDKLFNTNMYLLIKKIKNYLLYHIK